MRSTVQSKGCGNETHELGSPNLPGQLGRLGMRVGHSAMPGPFLDCSHGTEVVEFEYSHSMFSDSFYRISSMRPSANTA